MINVVKYSIEGLIVAIVTSLLARGAVTFGEVFFISIFAVTVFFLFDKFLPFNDQLDLGYLKGGAPTVEPDMCGGGLLEALQTAGAASPVHDKPPVQIPYKMVSCDYGAGVLLAGFNENAEGYNADKINEFASF